MVTCDTLVVVTALSPDTVLGRGRLG
jgi:hypothetical protein